MLVEDSVEEIFVDIESFGHFGRGYRSDEVLNQRERNVVDFPFDETDN